MSKLAQQPVRLEDLKNDPASFLALGVSDRTLQKLESYRLYKAGVSVSEIAQMFDFSRGYLYEMWKKFEIEGTEALINKHWGATPRKRTDELEAQVLRTKALNPFKSDSDLAQEFGLHRSTVYRLLKEHGLQDLHRVLESPLENVNVTSPNQIELVSCPQSLLLTLLPKIEQSGALSALSILQTGRENALYSDRQLQLGLLLLTASGIWRLSHINHQPTKEWGVLLDSQRRPDSDTLNQHLQKIIELDEMHSSQSVIERLGQVVPGGLIEQAQLESFRLWVEADLMASQVWYFDVHVIEYTGKAKLGKTKHGTKNKVVKAIKRFTISNGLCSLDYYAPTCISYAEGCRHLITLANNTLHKDKKIRLLAFDREGWDRQLLNWLENKAQIIPITWVKKTKKITAQLEKVPTSSFRDVAQDLASTKDHAEDAQDSTYIEVGKDDPKRIVSYADVKIELSDWGPQRVIILQTEENKRLAIYTTASAPQTKENTLADELIVDSTCKRVDSPNEKTTVASESEVRISHPTLPLVKSSPKSPTQNASSTVSKSLTSEISSPSPEKQAKAQLTEQKKVEKKETTSLTALELLESLRLKQQLENQFKVEKNEMGCDAIPTHTTYEATVRVSYDKAAAERKLESANNRVKKYQTQSEKEKQLHERGEIDKHQLNHLQKRSKRLEKNARKEFELLSEELLRVETDENGADYVPKSYDVLDVRKLTLLNLFKHHALVILKLLAQTLGLKEAGPKRLRRSFFAFGQRVEFDPLRGVATVYAAPFPTAEMKQAYAHLCQQLNADPPVLKRQEMTYYVHFKDGE